MTSHLLGGETKARATKKRPNKGMFAPGVIRGRAARLWCAIGTVKVMRLKHGPCWMVKVKDEGPRHERWVPVSRVTWERLHGPIPPGCYIVHADDDTLNDDPSNLMCLTQAEMMKRNSWRKNRERHAKRISAAHKERFAAMREQAAIRREVVERPEPSPMRSEARSKARERLEAFKRELEAVA